jgi:hypothetical protein
MIVIAKVTHVSGRLNLVSMMITLHSNCTFQKYIIHYVSPEVLTTERMIPSGTNSHLR